MSAEVRDEVRLQARVKLEPFLKEQPENYNLIGDLALTDSSLGRDTMIPPIFVRQN